MTELIEYRDALTCAVIHAQEGSLPNKDMVNRWRELLGWDPLTTGTNTIYEEI